MISNTDSTDSVQFSADGTNGFTIKAGQSLGLDVSRRYTYFTKAVSGTPALEVLLGSED